MPSGRRVDDVKKFWSSISVSLCNDDDDDDDIFRSLSSSRLHLFTFLSPVRIFSFLKKIYTLYPLSAL